MKVGIVTQPLYANYGGILQNYALQQVLKKMGHTPVTLDYMPSLSFGRYLLYAGKGLLCCIFPSKRHAIKPYRRFLERPEAIDAFVRNNIDKTVKISAYSKRVLSKNGIEALVVGSDQVWRYAYNSNVLEDMYLGFAKDYPCRKIAYAASFGVEQWDYPEERSKCAAVLTGQLDAVSVREDSAVELCRKNLGVEARAVLDPTLLLDASYYEKFCRKPDPEEEPYLAAYVLDLNEEKMAFIRAMAESRNLKVRQMTVSDKGVSVEEWLSTIRNAEFVITDSYHGSLFSIIFEKQFQTIVNRERGADRFKTLFSRLGLNSRLLDIIPQVPASCSRIDYATVYNALNSLQEDSLSFIKESLS